MPCCNWRRMVLTGYSSTGQAMNRSVSSLWVCKWVGCCDAWTSSCSSDAWSRHSRKQSTQHHQPFPFHYSTVNSPHFPVGNDWAFSLLASFHNIDCLAPPSTNDIRSMANPTTPRVEVEVHWDEANNEPYLSPPSHPHIRITPYRDIEGDLSALVSPSPAPLRPSSSLLSPRLTVGTDI